MSIGALEGEKHTFMHDLESFFWVLWWICTHYSANGRDVGPTEYDSWNYQSDEQLGIAKSGLVVNENKLLRIATENFTPYYQALIPWIKPHSQLYSSMKSILREAQADPEVLADG